MSNPTAYLLKVTLKYVPNAIWRRFVVPSDIMLDELHEVLQAVMGWHNCHLHAFTAGQKRYGSDRDVFFDDLLPEEKYSLADIATKKGSKIHYEYDFGDGWDHEIVVENTKYSNPDWPYPVYCIEGACACPPEDCGGVPGYMNFCEAIADKKHQEHRMLKEWYGGKYDPDHFDLARVNKMLGVKPVKPKKTTTPRGA
ncbi:MAG: plasmid pRiA4b ORF-3 family protein [Acidobacteriota bacterium]|jgi:hypothetical protein|nr:plasmid pRiA4b ORF-3 family protein [Acidobacteriota bacterium]